MDLETNPPDPTPTVTQTTNHFYHVRVRPEAAFTAFRTPLGLPEMPTSLVTPGCDVRQGRWPDGTWLVESVLIPLDGAADTGEAQTLAWEAIDSLEG